jgi:hypothetical protein
LVLKLFLVFEHVWPIGIFYLAAIILWAELLGILVRFDVPRNSGPIFLLLHVAEKLLPLVRSQLGRRIPVELCLYPLRINPLLSPRAIIFDNLVLSNGGPRVRHRLTLLSQNSIISFSKPLAGVLSAAAPQLQRLFSLVLLYLLLDVLLYFVRMVRVALPLDLGQQMPLVLQEKGMFENLIGRALSLRLVEVVHVQLPDK